MTLRLFEISLPVLAEDLNKLRGALGRGLYGTPHYKRLFSPEEPAGAPSGLRNPPRPYVLRPGAINVFSGIEDAKIVASALRLPDAPIRAIEIDLEALQAVTSMRVEFLSPTILKGSRDRPDFRTLFSRARDRVSTLRMFYGDGALDLDFRAMGDLAGGIVMERWEIQHRHIARRSSATGQIHSIGGFMGFAEYVGDLTPFAGILNAARYTGVGSKTAWGNGHLRVVTPQAPI